MKKGMSKKKIAFASILGCILTLQLGAFSVTIETLLSGVTELPFVTFLTLMQPIHLAIGLIEGLITAAVLCFIYEARPEMLQNSKLEEKTARLSYTEIEASENEVYETSSEIQEATSILPDYTFEGSESKIGTSVSGILGAFITVGVLVVIGYIVKIERKKELKEVE